MRGPAVRPRHDQVAELTRGVRLPLAPIADEHLEILAEGLRRAFDDIRAHAPTKVATGQEPEVTAFVNGGVKMYRRGGVKMYCGLGGSLSP